MHENNQSDGEIDREMVEEAICWLNKYDRPARKAATTGKREKVKKAQTLLEEALPDE